MKLFKKFLKMTYTKAERRFLIMSVSGAKSQELRQRLGITDILKYREAVQEKGFKNAEALRAAVVFSGWSRAEEFAETIFRRVEMYHRGENVIEELPENKRARKSLQKSMRYYEENREKVLERSKRYYGGNREKMLECFKRYYEGNREKLLERSKRYYEENREKMREYRKAHPEKTREYRKAYREAHREENKEYQKAYRARRKMEKLAAKLRAEENLPAIRIEEAEAPQEIIIE